LEWLPISAAVTVREAIGRKIMSLVPVGVRMEPGISA